jgi:hypothetical protein
VYQHKLKIDEAAALVVKGGDRGSDHHFAPTIGASFPAESMSGWHGLCVDLSEIKWISPIDTFGEEE